MDSTDIAARKAEGTRARAVARALLDSGAPIEQLAYYVIEDLHRAFPFLAILKNRARLSAERDCELAGVDDVIDMLNLEDSPETKLAQAAYDAALRAVVYGHDLDS